VGSFQKKKVACGGGVVGKEKSGNLVLSETVNVLRLQWSARLQLSIFPSEESKRYRFRSTSLQASTVAPLCVNAWKLQGKIAANKVKDALPEESCFVCPHGHYRHTDKRGPKMLEQLHVRNGVLDTMHEFRTKR